MTRKQAEKQVDLGGARILVAGATGFLGGYISHALKTAGAEVMPLSRSQGFDLRNEAEALQAVLVSRPDIIVDVAGPSGGLAYLASKPATVFRDSMLIGMNLVQAAASARARLVTIGTPASYPVAGAPVNEAAFWKGMSHYMVSCLGVARKAILTMCQTYKAQHGLNFMYLVPSTVYGPGDKFVGNRASGIAAMIRRFCQAVQDQDDAVICWGKPDVQRSFVFATDFAQAVALACAREGEFSDLINVAGGPEITMGKLAEFLAKETGFEGEVSWDAEKPSGAERRTLDGKLAKSVLGWVPKTSLEDGIRATIAWFNKNKPEE